MELAPILAYRFDMAIQPRPIGKHLRDWRQRRRLSQLNLAGDAEISARHLSFLETGRAQPSREMILRLAEQLDIPIRERNVLLVAAGFAPIFPERRLNDPALALANDAITLALDAHKPYPAFALDRLWRVLASNAALPELFEGVTEELLAPPMNALRISLHPRGLAPRIANLAVWRTHLLYRLRRQVDLTADAALVELQRELLSYPAPPEVIEHPVDQAIIPLQIHVGGKLLSLFSTTMIFGTPADITLSELALEFFFPANAQTAASVRDFAVSRERALDAAPLDLSI
jgi:transcriptional regulator with XRE-family HTH domain